MKIRLTLTVAALLIISMLLVNLVLLLFWQRDAIQREAKHDLAVLTHFQQQIPHSVQKAGITFFSCSALGIETKNCQFVMLLQEAEESSTLPPLLVSTLQQSLSGTPVSHSAFGILSGKPPILASAQPLVEQEKIIGAIGIIRPLNSIFHSLWRAEKIVFIYLFFNLLILGLLSFFRINSLISRPIERLVDLAGTYNNQDVTWFATTDSGSEFQRLSNSLNKMLAGIEKDQKILRETVTELELANQRLREQQEEMVQAERLAVAGRLTAGLAHEIGNPLAVIQGYIDLLQRSCHNQEQKDFLKRADQELQRVSQLIRQLLDCTRISRGKPKIISVHELLNSVAEMVQVQKAFQEIEITTKLLADSDKIFADPDQIRQVLLNCLLNSADAINSTRRASGRIILFTDRVKQGLLWVRIQDNGTGIATEALAAVFDPFYTTKEPGKGTGLGLSVSRSMIEAAGGSMKIESQLGQGTTLSIYLPLCTQEGGSDGG